MKSLERGHQLVVLFKVFGIVIVLDVDLERVNGVDECIPVDFFQRGTVCASGAFSQGCVACHNGSYSLGQIVTSSGAFR